MGSHLAAPSLPLVVMPSLLKTPLNEAMKEDELIRKKALEFLSGFNCLTALPVFVQSFESLASKVENSVDFSTVFRHQTFI